MRRKVITNNSHLRANYDSRAAAAWRTLIVDIRTLIEERCGEEMEFQDQMDLLGGTSLEYVTSASEKQVKALRQEIISKKGVRCRMQLDSSGSAGLPLQVTFTIFHSPLAQHKWRRVCALTLFFGLMCFMFYQNYYQKRLEHNKV